MGPALPAMTASTIRRWVARLGLAALVLAAALLGAVGGLVAAYLQDLPALETLE